MKKFAPGLVPTLFTVPLIIALLALTIWQVNRYQWKIDWLDTLTSQLSEEPQAMPEGDFDLKEWNYRRVYLQGEFLHDKEIHLFAHADKGRQGFHVITPFEQVDGKGIVLVNRGWVPKHLKDNAKRAEGNIEGPLLISGIIRRPWAKSYSFLPESDVEDNVWLFGELAQMADHLNIEVAPAFVELDDMPVPGGFPKGGQTVITLHNDHIEYAITWFGLSLAMLVIYVVYGRRRAAGLVD